MNRAQRDYRGLVTKKLYKKVCFSQKYANYIPYYITKTYDICFYYTVIWLAMLINDAQLICLKLSSLSIRINVHLDGKERHA